MAILVIVPTLIVGAILRLYTLGDQILLDDEWHAIHYAANSTMGHLLTHMGYAATCIPQNAYLRALLTTVGWTEWFIRLPSIVAGLACLAIFPWFVRRVVDTRTTVLFGMLMALSPFLIFVSRFSRPYAPYLFTSFTALLAFHAWVTTEDRRFRNVYVVCGALAVYLHLWGVLAVFTPPAVAFLMKLRERQEKTAQVLPGLRPLVLTAVIAGAIVVGLLIIPTINSFGRFVGDRFQIDPPTWSSMEGASELLAGTANRTLVLAFLALMAVGAMGLVKRSRTLGWIFLATFAVHVLAMFATAPKNMNVPIQIARYCVPLFPISLLWVAVGVEMAVSRLRARFVPEATAAGLCTALFVTGPLPQTYRQPNDFTNHAAFQESYRQLSWDRPYHSAVLDFMSVAAKDLSPFYRRLASEKGPFSIIEYPSPIGHHFNPYYFYQHVHRKAVKVGYVFEPKIRVMARRKDAVDANTPADVVLSHVERPRQLDFRTMVNLMDLRALGRSGARYLILHRNLLAEAQGIRPLPSTSPLIDAVKDALVPNLGSPTYEDEWLVVFQVSNDARTQQ